MSYPNPIPTSPRSVDSTPFLAYLGKIAKALSDKNASQNQPIADVSTMNWQPPILPAVAGVPQTQPVVPPAIPDSPVDRFALAQPPTVPASLMNPGGGVDTSNLDDANEEQRRLLERIKNGPGYDTTAIKYPDTPPTTPLPTRDFGQEGRDAILAAGISTLLGGVLGGGRGAITAGTAGANAAREQGQNISQERMQEDLRKQAETDKGYQEQVQQALRQQQAQDRGNATKEREYGVDVNAYERAKGNADRLQYRSDENDIRKQAEKDAATGKRETLDGQQLKVLTDQLNDPKTDPASYPDIVNGINSIRKRLYPDLPPMKLNALAMTPRESELSRNQQAATEAKKQAVVDKTAQNRESRLRKEMDDNEKIAGNPVYPDETRIAAQNRNNQIRTTMNWGTALPVGVKDMTPYQQGQLDNSKSGIAIRQQALKDTEDARKFTQNLKKGSGGYNDYQAITKQISDMSLKKKLPHYDYINKVYVPLSPEQVEANSAADVFIEQAKQRQAELLKSSDYNADGSKKVDTGTPKGTLNLGNIPLGPISTTQGMSFSPAEAAALPAGIYGTGPRPITAPPALPVHHSATQPRTEEGKFNGPPAPAGRADTSALTPRQKAARDAIYAHIKGQH